MRWSSPARAAEHPRAPGCGHRSYLRPPAAATVGVAGPSPAALAAATSGKAAGVGLSMRPSGPSASACAPLAFPVAAVPGGDLAAPQALAVPVAFGVAAGSAVLEGDAVVAAPAPGRHGRCLPRGGDNQW
jgi:hypothetical protein